MCLPGGCRYEDALVLLLTEVLNRIQFRYNQAQLEELDDETLDDDVRSRATCEPLHCWLLEWFFHTLYMGIWAKQLFVPSLLCGA